MTIDRRQILDATALKLATPHTRMSGLRKWMDEAMSTLSVNEALCIPTVDGRPPRAMIQAARNYLNKLGGGAKTQFCVRGSADGKSAYLIRQAGPARGGAR